MGDNRTGIIRCEAQRRAFAGDLQGALELSRGIQPADVPTNILVGKIHAQQGAFREAGAAFRAALAAEPENAEAQRGLQLADRLATSSLGRLRLHLRRWVVAAGVLALLIAAAQIELSGRVSNRQLARTLAALDVKIEASQAGSRDDNRSLAERLSSIDRALQAQAGANERSNAEIRVQLHHLEQQLSGAVTDQQLKATRAEMMAALQHLEEALKNR